MKKKIAKKRAAALGNMRNIGEKQKQIYLSKCIFHLSTRDVQIYKRGAETDV